MADEEIGPETVQFVSNICGTAVSNPADDDLEDQEKLMLELVAQHVWKARREGTLRTIGSMAVCFRKAKFRVGCCACFSSDSTVATFFLTCLGTFGPLKS